MIFGRSTSSLSQNRNFGGRSRHHFPSTGCMDVEHPHAEPSSFDSSVSDGVGDVVKLEVEEDLRPRVCELADKCWSSRRKKLQADLKSANATFEFRNNVSRLP